MGKNGTESEWKIISSLKTTELNLLKQSPTQIHNEEQLVQQQFCTEDLEVIQAGNQLTIPYYYGKADTYRVEPTRYNLLPLFRSTF